MLSNYLVLNEDVFRNYAFYCAVLIAKILLMVPLTVRQRYLKKTVTSPEDTSLLRGLTVRFDDQDVERVRRAHLNDLESILPFLIIALLYCFTSPDPAMAHFLFKVFTGARIIHTLVYAVVPLPQPARGAAFFMGMGVTVFLTFKVLCHFY